MITELMSRLNSAETDYTTIDFVVDLDPSDKNLRTTMPLALFMIGPLTSEGSDTMPIRQRQTRSIVVETVCRHEQLNGLIDQLHAALIGYQDGENYTPLIHKQGDMIKIDGEIVRWVDMFITSHWIEEPA